MRPRKARGTPGLGVNGVPGERMAADKTTPPNDEVVAVSDEALQKAESFVEAEEGAANRLMGWWGRISTTIAVVMSLFHLYAAYAIVPTQELRYIHVAFTLVLSFLLFPLATRFRNRVRWWDIVPGIVAVATIARPGPFLPRRSSLSITNTTASPMASDCLQRWNASVISAATSLHASPVASSATNTNPVPSSRQASSSAASCAERHRSVTGSTHQKCALGDHALEPRTCHTQLGC